MKWCHHLLTLTLYDFFSYMMFCRRSIMIFCIWGLVLSSSKKALKSHSNMLSIHLDDISHRRKTVKRVWNNMRVSSLNDDKLFIFRWTFPLKQQAFVCRYRGLFKSINSIFTTAYCWQTDSVRFLIHPCVITGFGSSLMTSLMR